MKKTKKLHQVPALELPELLGHLACNHSKYRVSCADIDNGILNIGDVKIKRFPTADPDNICQEQFTFCTDNAFYVVLSDRIYDDEHDEPVLTGDAAKTLHTQAHDVFYSVVSCNLKQWNRKKHIHRLIDVFWISLVASIGCTIADNIIDNPKIKKLQQENESLKKVINAYDKQQMLNDPRITVVYDSVAKKTK